MGLSCLNALAVAVKLRRAVARTLKEVMTKAIERKEVSEMQNGLTRLTYAEILRTGEERKREKHMRHLADICRWEIHLPLPRTWHERLRPLPSKMQPSISPRPYRTNTAQPAAQGHLSLQASEIPHQFHQKSACQEPDLYNPSRK
jgi:hypothetical protein